MKVKTKVPFFWNFKKKKKKELFLWKLNYSGKTLWRRPLKKKGSEEFTTYCKAVSHSVVSNSLHPCGLPGASLHGFLQAKILEWVAIPFSRGSFSPRDWTRVSCIAGRFFTVWASRKTLTVMGVVYLRKSNSVDLLKRWPWCKVND